MSDQEARKRVFCYFSKRFSALQNNVSRNATSIKADYDSCLCSSSSANSHPPVLHVNGSLLVPLGGLAPLPPTLLQVSDPDSLAEQLVFSLVQAASNGELLLFGEEGGGGGTEGRELNSGDTFGWAELKEGQVRFRHRRNRARSVRWLPTLLLFSKFGEDLR